MLLALSTLSLQPSAVLAQVATAFTYQGRLNSSGSPASGNYDFRFKLYADPLGNTQVGASYLTNAIPVTAGLFITTIDFGAGIFTGSNYWLEVDVKTNNAGSYTVLSPLQAVTPTPYAVFASTASNLSGTLPAAQLSGTVSSANLSAIPNGSLANSSLTVTAGSGLTGGGSVSLGGSTSLSLDPSQVINWTAFQHFSGGLVIGFPSQSASGNGYLQSTDNSWIRLNPSLAVGAWNGLVQPGDQGITFEGTTGSGSGNFVIAPHANAITGIRITGSGNVGINKASPATALDVNGTVTANSFAGSFTGDASGLTNFNAALLSGNIQPPASVTPILDMIWIEPGTFIMGSPTNEQDRSSDEGPQTTVTLTRGFWMSHHPVTQGEYLSVMNANPSGFTGDLNLPVETVTWNNATNFCGTLTQREQSAGRLPTGWVYRLLTEAEWEYTCRAWTTTRLYYGNDLTYASLTNYAWFTSNSGNTTHPVGQKLANPWGLEDMIGNVWVWCQDWYGPYPGGSVSNPQGASTGSTIVMRGGGWNHDGPWYRSAKRQSNTTSNAAYNIGFRVVLAPQ